MTSIEVLLNNFLEPEIQQMIYPLNLMQKICVCSTYTVQDNLITPKGIKYNTIMFLGLVILVLVCAYRINAKNDPDSSQWMLILFYGFYLVGFIVLFINNCMFGNNSVLLVLKLQEIYKSLNFDALKIRNYIIWNWIYICGIVCVNFLMNIGYYAKTNDFDAFDIFSDFTDIVFDTNMVYLIRIIVILREYLIVWTNNYLADDDQAEERNWRSIFEAYKNILRGYNLYKSVFQVMVLYHTVDTFFRGLIYIQYYIEILKLPSGNKMIIETALVGALTVSLIIKDLLLLIVHNIECEKFYIKIQEAENFCMLHLMKSNSSDEARRACLNILLLRRSSFSKMSACGLVDIDATLPLQMLGLLTNYIIVLLQFAFL